MKAFLDDQAADKRAKLIDKLLDSPDYPAYFAMKWGAILRNSNLAGADQAAVAFHDWLKDQIARNRPYDEFVRGIVAAAGEWQDAPAVNWLWQNRDDQLHHGHSRRGPGVPRHALAVREVPPPPVRALGAGRLLRPRRILHADSAARASASRRRIMLRATPTTGEKDPTTGKSPEPKFLDGPVGKFSPDEDPRHALVDWMAKPDNPFFAKALVNRMWGHFLGRGLVSEVDDLRETNPPSNPELLDWLAKDFVKHKFDVKHVIRTILNSRVYQLSATPTEDNKHDRQNFARYYARRMPAEVFLDAVNATCGAKGGFGGNGVSANARAIDLPHEGFGSYFLDTFDRPKRVTVASASAPPARRWGRCSCWRTRRRSRTRSRQATAAWPGW